MNKSWEVIKINEVALNRVTVILEYLGHILVPSAATAADNRQAVFCQ